MSWWMVAAIASGLTAAKLLAYALLANGQFPRALCQWDCTWYVSIATHGYDTAPHLVDGQLQANWGFFPLYPLLIRGLDALTVSAPRVAGVVISTVCFVLFAVLGVRHRAVTRGRESIWIWLLLLTAWPYGFYFHAVYTEALYAVLAIAGLLALAEQRPFAASCACALLTATRPTGVLLAGWIGGERLVRAASPTSAWHARAVRMILLPAVVAPAGLLLFMLYQYATLGDPLAFAHIQMSGWQHVARDPAVVLWQGFRTFTANPLQDGAVYMAGWAVLGLAVTGWLLATRRFAEAWLCGATVLMVLATGSLWGMARYVAANPAFLLGVADLLSAIRWRILRAAILLAMADMQVMFVLSWYHGASMLN
jgi:hypothetical protein